jgi:serine-type D-Ala-D-Ala carboxypeptidase
MTNLTPLQELLDDAVIQGAFPAAQAAIVARGELVHCSAHGRDHRGAPTSDEALFDIASVTKAVATSLAVAVLEALGQLSLADPLERFFAAGPKALRGAGLATVTIRELLAHSSGLVAWRPYFLLARDDAEARAIFSEPREHSQSAFARARELLVEALVAEQIGDARGARVYSDVGFILLGLVIEAVTGEPLDRACRELVFEPLELREIGFSRLDDGATPWLAGRSVIATGQRRPREPAPGQESLYQVEPRPLTLRPGEVDDDNAFALGGVAGHAGLFTNAKTLAWLAWFVYEELQGADRLGAADTLRRMARVDEHTQGSRRGLGFDMPAPIDSAAGSLLGKAGDAGAIGHLGFTGCSFWLDLDRALAIALLTNRTLPGRDNVQGVRALRPRFHDLAISAIDEARSSAHLL